MKPNNMYRLRYTNKWTLHDAIEVLLYQESLTNSWQETMRKWDNAYSVVKQQRSLKAIMGI